MLIIRILKKVTQDEGKKLTHYSNLYKEALMPKEGNCTLFYFEKSAFSFSLLSDFLFLYAYHLQGKEGIKIFTPDVSAILGNYFINKMSKK